MAQESQSYPVESFRDPSSLMKPERLGALKQTRLSFARLLVRRMVNEQWDIELCEIDLDEEGNGRAQYHIQTPSHEFSYPIFSQKISEEEKTDRITADTWDMWGFLCEGTPDEDFIEWQFEELPNVRTGRANPEVLIWTRANRSSRFFDHIVDSLTAGRQPDIDYLAKGGYLVRSSGYYGNGLNGTKVFRAYDSDHPLSEPFVAQMFAAYMWRVFGYDLADTIAKERNSEAASLDSDIKRYIGTGNSSGMGVALFAMNHPKLVHTWLRAREIALARVKAIEPSKQDIEKLTTYLHKAKVWFSEDESKSKEFFQSKDKIAEELAKIQNKIYSSDTDISSWNEICEWIKSQLSAETQEVLYSVLIDIYPERSENLDNILTTSEKTDIIPDMTVSKLRALIESGYQWALDIDLTEPSATQHFWYRSVKGEEPRLGIVGENDAEEYSLPVDIAKQVQDLKRDLDGYTASNTVSEFLFEHPKHHYIVERIQNVHNLQYGEIQGNPLDADFIPLHLVALIKSFWGIQKAHPANKGWVKGTFFQGAPLPADIREGDESYWLYPPRPEQAEQRHKQLDHQQVHQ